MACSLSYGKALQKRLAIWPSQNTMSVVVLRYQFPILDQRVSIDFTSDRSWRTAPLRAGLGTGFRQSVVAGPHGLWHALLDLHLALMPRFFAPRARWLSRVALKDSGEVRLGLKPDR
jgi:hypothetical protein